MYAFGAYRQQLIVFVRSRDGHTEHAVPEATQICRLMSSDAVHGASCNLFTEVAAETAVVVHERIADLF